MIDEPTIDTIQQPITIKRVLFKVTTCLYLRPSSKARSLSTLIAVSVINDTAHKVTLAKDTVKFVLEQISRLLFTTDIKYATCRGSTMIPTQRWVIARLRYRSLDGG